MSPRSASGNGASVRASAVPIKARRGQAIGFRKFVPEDLSPLAVALREARVAAGKSQFDLASALGVGPSAIGMVESARGRVSSRVLTEENIRKSAAFLGCDPAILLRARALCGRRFELDNLSEEHAETALELLAAWETATPEMLRQVRAVLAGGAR